MAFNQGGINVLSKSIIIFEIKFIELECLLV